MGSRRKGRELALKALYRADLTGEDAGASLISVVELLGQGDPGQEASAALAAQQISPEALRFAHRLVVGVKDHLDRIDGLLVESVENWKLDRMTVIDRNILRLAAFEILFCPDIPERVSINEAIELGKRFGTQDSFSFINGVLDGILKATQGANKEALDEPRQMGTPLKDSGS